MQLQLLVTWPWERRSSRWAQLNHRHPWNQSDTMWEELNLPWLALKMEEGAMRQEMQAACRNWSQGNRFFFPSESHSVMSNSLWPHGLYSPWNSPGQNTGVGSLSLLQGIFPTQGWNPGLPHCRWILYQLSHRGSLREARKNTALPTPWPHPLRPMSNFWPVKP